MKKYFLYFLGLNLIAFAVVLNVRFDLGVAAFSSVMYSISQIYNISLGTASIICYLIFVIIQCILSKKITVTFMLEIPLSFNSYIIVKFILKGYLFYYDDVHYCNGRIFKRENKSYFNTN